MGNNIFTLCSCFYSILLTITYFSKKRIISYENKLYEKIVLLNVISAAFALGTYYTIMYSMSPFLINLCSKGLLVVYFLWLSQLTRYTYVIMHPLDKGKDIVQEFKKIRQILNIAIIIFIIGIIVLPINYSFEGNNIFTYGISANLTYIGAAIYWILWMYFIIRNLKKVDNKKSLIPILILMISMPLVLLLQKANPTLLLSTFLEGFATMVMYFTIENPDLQMLREFSKAREYAMDSNKEKEVFLFNMSNQIKRPVELINNVSGSQLVSDDIDKLKKDAKLIKTTSVELLQLINNVLDISELEKREIEIRKNKYNVFNLFNSINKSFKQQLSNNIEYRFNYDNSIPEYLYGDSIRLKQVMQIILDNAKKYTKEGFVEINVNSIMKYDICRLIITIEDSGIGMTSEQIKNLFDKDKIYKDVITKEIDDTKNNMSMAKSLVNLMGGSIMVNSEYGKGTKLIIVIDQKLDQAKTKIEETVEKYEEIYEHNKKILLVINHKDISKKINTILKKEDYDILEVSHGQTCLEKIRNNEKFDLIIMEDELEKLSCEDTLKKLKSMTNVKIPVILISNSQEFNIKQKYEEQGFKDIIFLPIKKEEFLKSIEKILKTNIYLVVEAIICMML